MSKFNVSSLLELLPVVGPIVARLPQFVAIYNQIVETFDDDSDQETLKAALVKAQQRNDDAHAALQDRLDNN